MFTTWKRGYTVKFWRIMRFYVPKGLLKWVPKVPKVSKVPINNYGLPFIKEPNIASWILSFSGILSGQETLSSKNNCSRENEPK